MTRYGDDYDEQFPGQSGLWMANLTRAIRGKHGQRDLRILEQALLDLPEKRLIEDKLANGKGEMCAIGLYAYAARCSKGEKPERVLDELRAASGLRCTCWHSIDDHHMRTGECSVCATSVGMHAAKEEAGEEGPWRGKFCHAFVEEESAEMNDYETVDVGKAAGMTSVLAWKIGYLNDEQFGGLAPEVRYEKVLAWVRDNLIEEAVA